MWNFTVMIRVIQLSICQTAEYGFGAPKIYFSTILGALKVHYVIILDSLARPNTLIRFGGGVIPPLVIIQQCGAVSKLIYQFLKRK